jgi:hypothetical protein
MSCPSPHRGTQLREQDADLDMRDAGWPLGARAISSLLNPIATSRSASTSRSVNQPTASSAPRPVPPGRGRLLASLNFLNSCGRRRVTGKPVASPNRPLRPPRRSASQLPSCGRSNADERGWSEGSARAVGRSRGR